MHVRTQRLTRATVLILLGLLPGPFSVVRAQTDAPRHHEHRGLTVELSQDWYPYEDDPWYFRSKSPEGGNISFTRWLPIRDSWYLQFERWVKEHLRMERRVGNVTGVQRLKVGGLDAVRFVSSDFLHPKVTVHETWIAVPDGRSGGGVFTFTLTTVPTGAQHASDLAAYERMLRSMRLDPVQIQGPP